MIRSGRSGQNRIIIEAKDTAKLGDGIVDSQAVRYFLWLLGMTEKAPYRPGIQRAFLLASPSRWFGEDRTSRSWNSFLETCQPLASEQAGFETTLGGIRCDNLPA